MAKKRKPDEEKLRPKHQLFAECYIANGFRVTKAAIDAGYSEKTAAAQGSRLLKNVKIQAYISKRMSELVMSKEEVLYRISEHGRSDIREFIGKSSDEIRDHPKGWLIKKYKQKARRLPGSELVEEYVEVEMLDPQSALLNIAKHHGLLIEKHEHTGKDGGPIITRSMTDEELERIASGSG